MSNQPAPITPQAQAAKDDETSVRTAGQRRINLLWEATQAVVAVSVTFGALYVSIWQATHGTPSDAAFLLLSNAFFLVIGTYITRTNHQKTGGVQKDDTGR